MRAYLAGPMTGLPDSNYPAFNQAAGELRRWGWEIENPAENPEPPCRSWLGYMRMAIPQLTACDAVVLLPGWEQSRGARIEFQLATALGLRILTLESAFSSLVEATPA